MRVEEIAVRQEVRRWIKQKYITRDDSADFERRNQEAGKICGRAY